MCVNYVGMYFAFTYGLSAVFLRTPSRERGKGGLLYRGLIACFSISVLIVSLYCSLNQLNIQRCTINTLKKIGTPSGFSLRGDRRPK